MTDDLFHDPKKLRRLVGILAFLLPTSLLIVGVAPQVCFHRTISHFYFSPLGGDILVGILFFIGFFLISYNGERGYEHVKWDRWISTIAGVCAFGIAIFPAEGTGCNEVAFQTVTFVDETNAVRYQFFPGSGNLHGISTAGFFLALAYFSLYLFTKSSPNSDKTQQKKRRNIIYKTTGTIILLILVLMAIRKFAMEGVHADIWDHWHLTFVLEALGLYAFGFAWWVKGEGLAWVND